MPDWNALLELAKAYPNWGATIIGVAGTFFAALFGFLLKRPMMKQAVKADQFKTTIAGLETLLEQQRETIADQREAISSHEADREHWYRTRAQLELQVQDLESRLRPWPDTPTEKATVIVVEDDVRGARVILRMLERMSIEGFVTTRGYDALRHARTGQFRLMILDFGLPDISGIDVAIQMRREGIDIPIIAFTGVAAVDLPMQGERMREAKFSTVISKTSRGDVVIAAIREALDGPNPTGDCG